MRYFSIEFLISLSELFCCLPQNKQQRAVFPRVPHLGRAGKGEDLAKTIRECKPLSARRENRHLESLRSWQSVWKNYWGLTFLGLEDAMCNDFCVL